MKAKEKLRRAESVQDMADRIVVEWISDTQTPPMSLAELVRKYRDLDFTVRTAEDPDPIYDEQNAIYDVLLHVAENGIPFQRKCDIEIARWRREGRA